MFKIHIHEIKYSLNVKKCRYVIFYMQKLLKIFYVYIYGFRKMIIEINLLYPMLRMKVTKEVMRGKEIGIFLNGEAYLKLGLRKSGEIVR